MRHIEPWTTRPVFERRGLGLAMTSDRSFEVDVELASLFVDTLA